MAETGETAAAYDVPGRRMILCGAAGLAGLAGLAGCAKSKIATKVPDSAKGRTLAKTSEIPVGGGKVFSDQKVVVTQPTAGTYKAFLATCTHQGCTVGSVSDGRIMCPCHGSEFAIADGSVARGPAGTALHTVSIEIQGDSIVVI